MCGFPPDRARQNPKTTPSGAPGIYLTGKGKRFIQLRFVAKIRGDAWSFSF
jgi:hypothetical protein